MDSNTFGKFSKGDTVMVKREALTPEFIEIYGTGVIDCLLTVVGTTIVDGETLHKLELKGLPMLFEFNADYLQHMCEFVFTPETLVYPVCERLGITLENGNYPIR